MLALPQMRLLSRSRHLLPILKLNVYLLVGLLLFCSCEQLNYVQLSGYAQGGTWIVKYNTAGVKMRPAEVQKGIEAILHDIDTTLSGYNKGSQLSQLNAGKTVVPSPMLCDLYERCFHYWEQTNGALDIAAGPLFDIWGFGFKNDSLPSNDQVLKALSISGMDRLVPSMKEVLWQDGELHASRLLRQSNSFFAESTCSGKDFSKDPTYSGNSYKDVIPQLNFNAIAQGYSCDTVARYLSSLGVWDMLVDIGEIWCRGLSPSGKPWKIGIDRPIDGNNSPGADIDGIWQSCGFTLDSCLSERSILCVGSADYLCEGASTTLSQALLGGQGIVTSGNYRKFYIQNGQKFSHTIDPRTGYPANNSLLSATIVAPSAELADAYATYCMVIGLDSAKEFICSTPQIEGYLIYSIASGSMLEWRSDGFYLAK